MAEKVQALIEVKAARRRDRRAQIGMQEAAQMVAWIKEVPDLNGPLNRTGRYCLPPSKGFGDSVTDAR